MFTVSSALISVYQREIICSRRYRRYSQKYVYSKFSVD